MNFFRWARECSLARHRSVAALLPEDVPAVLGRMIGSASLVAFGEAAHGAAEPLEFRNRLFRYLVEQMGFTAIALESGRAESEIVREYVHGGSGDLARVLKNGITWGFGELPQNAELVRWMRNYNATARPRAINFYGFDMDARQVAKLFHRDNPQETASYVVSEEMSAAFDERDRAQADNIEWIVEQEGPSGRSLIFASRYHLSGSPLQLSYRPHARETRQQPAGVHLRRRYGKKLVSVCNLVGEGEVACGGYREILGRAPAESVDGIAAQLGEPLLILDLRDAPATVANELRQECELTAGCQTLKLPLADAFDILLYIEKVTPACV